MRPSPLATRSAGRSIAEINPLNEITTTVYDDAGRTVETIDPLGNRTTTLYDAAGRAIASTNPLNETTTTVYDAAGRTVQSINPLSEISSTVYDAAGRSIAAVDPLGNRSTTVYDLAGRTVQSINPLGEVSSTGYDRAGRSIASVDPSGHRSTTVYDAAGRSEGRAQVARFLRLFGRIDQPALPGMPRRALRRRVGLHRDLLAGRGGGIELSHHEIEAEQQREAQHDGEDEITLVVQDAILSEKSGRAVQETASGHRVVAMSPPRVAAH